MKNPTEQHDERVRLDKWLWAARFFKHRSLATEAVDGGKIQLNGIRVKPAKEVKIGDTVVARCTIKELTPEKRKAKFDTVCTVRGKVVLEGEADIMVPAR